MTTDSSIHPFTQLDGEQFIVLTTYRKTGEAVPTTVWFAEREGKLYISTGATAGKLKRIRTNPKVTIAPSDHIGAVKGGAIAAVAREATPDEHALAEAELAAKYGAQLGEVRRMRRPAHETSTHPVVAPAE